MSQITKSVQMPAVAPGWATPRTIALFVLAVAGLIIASALAVGMLSNTPTAVIERAAVPVAPSYSRLDDYGLRHPNPFGATTDSTDSRLDDYGLRHPNPFGATTDSTDSRLDDHGLRHPNPFGTKP
jgi:hypothetical protein